MNEAIFRKKSLEHISSPDKLDRYLKVSRPSVWLVILALLLVLLAAGAWCFFGNMPTTAMGVGIKGEEGEAVCFVPAQEGYEIIPGMQVRLTPTGAETVVTGQVEKVGDPQPAEEAAQAVKAGWLTMPDGWVCPVTVELKGGELPANAACSAQIIIDQRRPIDLLLGR